MSKVPSSPINIIQFIRQNSIHARRDVLDFILEGRVCINKQTITDSSTMVNDTDSVSLDGKPIQYQPFYYYKFNKPVGTISTFDDPGGRKTLRSHLDKFQLPKSLKPCGRLDRDSSGLLLFSNDGEFINHVLHPSFDVPKSYFVTLSAPLSNAHQKQLTSGLFLDDGPVSMTFIDNVSPTQCIIQISIGRNRIVRRAFKHFGYTVIGLHRLSIGDIQLNHLREGEFDIISDSLVQALLNPEN